MGRSLRHADRQGNRRSAGVRSAQAGRGLCVRHHVFRRSNHHGGGHRAAPASSGGRSGQPADVYLVLPGLGALFEVAVPGNDRPSVHRQVAAADVRRGRQDLAGTQPRRGCGQNLQHLHHAVHRKKGRARAAEHGFGRSRQRCRSGHHHPRAGAHGACRAPRCGKHRGIRV